MCYVCLCYATENGFTARQTAQLMDASMRTIERRLQEWDIRSEFSEVSDAQLDAFLSPLISANPTLGLFRTCFLMYFKDQLSVRSLWSCITHGNAVTMLWVVLQICECGCTTYILSALTAEYKTPPVSARGREGRGGGKVQGGRNNGEKVSEGVRDQCRMRVNGERS